ncbi:hypothetical protein HH800_16625 [Sphingobium yanoikuyae]|uniref:Uncharacterized protein n=1 Tax=Sphingobium yanoikuyae TaxID=13690 RepID=A0A6M4GAP7_SPHYA|nr:hypothetical protein [Sphingobium yanoikuyae]QJR03664.1 hypothetical protein HH800_16625 [Sphingobium yanoikuyae]
MLDEAIEGSSQRHQVIMNRRQLTGGSIPARNVWNVGGCGEHIHAIQMSGFLFLHSEPDRAECPIVRHYSLVQNLSDADKSDPTGKISAAGPEFREGRSTGEERRAGYGAQR